MAFVRRSSSRRTWSGGASAASHHDGRDEQVALVDAPGLDRLGGGAGTGHADVTSRCRFHLSDRFGIEVPLDPRHAAAASCRRAGDPRLIRLGAVHLGGRRDVHPGVHQPGWQASVLIPASLVDLRLREAFGGFAVERLTLSHAESRADILGGFQ
jgi:hypothetical protein